MPKKKYALIIHGGVGSMRKLTTKERSAFHKSVLKIVFAGEAALKKGKNAVDVVEECVTLLENDPLYNAGKGSVLNEKGKAECEASIMDGKDLGAGAIAGVTSIKNPVRLARKVMTNSEHIMLISKGAEQFAKKQGFKLMPDSYFQTNDRLKQWREARKAGVMILDHDDVEEKYGTVGAVARDRGGNLAAATSTGGIVNKRYGRVSDTPLIGSGVFADNKSCAVSCTGFGEQIMRVVLAKSVADLVALKKLSAEKGAKEAIKNMVKQVKGLAGVIVIDKSGRLGVAFSTPQIIYGSVKEGGKIISSMK